MPYNTRRKSLSLESLGIHVPSSSRVHRSPPTMPTSAKQDQTIPPSKKVKRSHTLSSTGSTPSSISSTPRRTSIKFLDERPKSRAAENTPPPSPGREVGQNKIDIEGINDDIVVGVIQQLEATGNRPHLLKELAAVLSTQLQVVQTSANQAAIISSRLANYLRRPWTILAPCPLDKVLVGTHPKRVYYFLTTMPQQPIPPPPESGAALASRIITPSLSSAADEEEEEADLRGRAEMSPSPEVELFNLDFDERGLSTPFSEHGPSHQTTPSDMEHNHRAASPPLECVEREFSNMANTLQQRSRSQSETVPETSTELIVETAAITIEIEETEESAARKNSEAAAALFGSPSEDAPVHATLSSPVIKPQSVPSIIGQKRPLDVDTKMTEETRWAWDELKSPENVELDELEDMFDNY